MNPEGVEPKQKSTVDGHALSLPKFYETVYKLSDIIDVDYYLPGCPPMPETIADAIGAILEGNLPPKGAILSPNKSLCSSCDRNETKPEDVCIDELKRIIDVEADPETCFLAQGIICMGPATRDGCGFPCVKGNMPCTGCYGPTDACKDQGAKMVATLGAILDAENEEAVEKIIEGIPDPGGTFYRYAMSASLLGAERKEVE